MNELDELLAKIKRQLDFAPNVMYNDVVGLLEYISKSLPQSVDHGSFAWANEPKGRTAKFLSELSA